MGDWISVWDSQMWSVPVALAEDTSVAVLLIDQILNGFVTFYCAKLNPLYGLHACTSAHAKTSTRVSTTHRLASCRSTRALTASPRRLLLDEIGVNLKPPQVISHQRKCMYGRTFRSLNIQSPVLKKPLHCGLITA